jgi:hypothetical protein
MSAGLEQHDKDQDTPIDCLGLRLTRQFEKMLRHTCMDIFTAHRSVLLAEPIVYIVAAVWGSPKWGELTSTQLEIFARVKPVVEQMQLALESEKLDQEQTFVRGYLIRGLLITRIFYMIELWKNNILTKEAHFQPLPHSLHWIKPLGNA